MTREAATTANLAHPENIAKSSQKMSMALLEHPEFGAIYAGPVVLPNGKIAYVIPLTYGRARINVGDLWGVDDGY